MNINGCSYLRIGIFMVLFLTMSFKGKCVVITGSCGGIGSLLTQKMDQLGATLILLERDVKLFDGLDLINRQNHYFYECDMKNEFNVEKVARDICAKFPKVDCLFNVAGLGIYKDLADLGINDWTDTLSINVTAPLILSKFILPSLERNGSGLIFNIGSGMGVIPSAGRVSYCSSKFALRGMSLTLSKELKSKNIDVVLLTLGSVMTEFGTGGLEHRKKLALSGKNYLTPEEVVEKIISITESENRNSEYEFFPEGYISEK